MTTLTRLVNYYIRQDQYPSRYSLAQMRLGANVLDVPKADVKLNSFPIEEDEVSIAESIADGDVIGLPSFMWTTEKTIKIANHIASLNSKSLILVGGPDTPYLDLKRFPENTLYVMGEGEYAFNWILAQKINTPSFGPKDLPKNTPSEIFTNHGYDFIPVPRPRIQSTPLFSKKFMKLFGDDLPEKDFIWAETVRSCLYECGYCGYRTRPKLAMFDDEFVTQEFKNFSEFGFQRIYFADPILGGTPKRSKWVLKQLQTLLPDTTVKAFFRPEFFDYEYLDILEGTKIENLSLGLQTFNPSVPNWVRNNSLDRIMIYLPELAKRKVPWTAELIVGLPGDNYEGLRQSLKIVIEDLNPTQIRAYHLNVIPGTKMNTILERRDLPEWVSINNNDLHVVQSNSFSQEELTDMMIYATAVSAMYNALQENNWKTIDSKKTFPYIEKHAAKALVGLTHTELDRFKQQDEQYALEHMKTYIAKL